MIGSGAGVPVALCVVLASSMAAGVAVAAFDPVGTAHGAAMAHQPFYQEFTFHALVGLVAAVVGVLAHRAWSHRRWRRAPAGVVIEAVLAVDLVNSTWLASHHGEDLAMRARGLLERRALSAAKDQGVTFVESTGDGCMMMFPTVVAAAKTAAKLVSGLHVRPPDMSPGPSLENRAGIAYGQILLDSHGARHGSAINKAFRLMNLSQEAFVNVEGEATLEEKPDRNRIFVDEDAANELIAPDAGVRQVGVCRLKGFSGFHRVYQLNLEGL